MTISKASLSIMLMMFGLQADVSLVNHSITIETQYVLNTAHDWQKKDITDVKTAGKWLEKIVLKDKFHYPIREIIMAILVNDKLELNEKASYILQVKEQQKKKRNEEKLERIAFSKRQFKEVMMIFTAIGVACTVFSPFIAAGIKIGDGFGKYIREHAWPNLDVDKRGWN